MPPSSRLQPHRWPGLESVAKVSTERTCKGKTSHDVRYYLCSFKAEAAKVLHVGLCSLGSQEQAALDLDVVFNEDQHRYAERRGAGNMSVSRQFALNPLRQDKSKGSLEGKRKRAAWDDDFRARIVKGLNID